tara:strand:+ start:72207 stop:74600 length:2394 start_codon:yes stop_codon:yes gene_type:complete
MNTNRENITPDNIKNNKFNLRKAFSMYLDHWKWFVISCVLFLGVGFMYLRYTIPEYKASAKVMILSEQDGATAGAAFQDLSLFSAVQESKMEDEVYVIKSRSFLRKIIKKLSLNVRYYVKGRVLETELYKNTPIDINFLAPDSSIDQTNFNFYIDVTSSLDFNYRINEDDLPKKVAFGEKISTSFGGMIITPKETNNEKIIGTSIRIKITPVNKIAQSLKRRISILPSKHSSKVLDFSLQDPIDDKAKDIINTLIAQYNISTIEEKNIKSKNTANFIDKRVELIASDLVNVDDSIVRFKTGNKVTDITSEVGMFLNSNALNEQELDAAKTQLSILNYTKDYLKTESSKLQPLPSNMGGMDDPSIAALSTQYNELLKTRESRSKSAGEKNSIIVELDQTIRGVRETLLQNIENSRRAMSIRLGSLENKSDRINSKIHSVPGQANKLRSIERAQGVKETLYLYLLQKREEATISLTATSASAKVIDEAYSGGSPVFPNTNMVYIAALFLGLFVPFSIVYVGDLLDTKIHSKEDLEAEIRNISILGEIPRIKNKNKILVERNDRSILSESFRIIRTNFDYIKRGREVVDYDNVVFVTSTIKGEGKSFFSLNTALTMANTNKRVLLIGADIRNPQIHSVLKGQIKPEISKIGLTEYLVDKSILVGETINTYNVNDIEIDILLSGKIPPNPAELLMNDRIKDLFNYASNQYDIVIVDTAPAMLVTDTLLISQYAGHTIYITRADYTEKQVLSFTKELYVNNKLSGMMLVVNDVKQSNFGYGAKYGYYAASEKKGFFRKKNKA